MPRVGFEPTIPAFERAKTVHALDHATALIGICTSYLIENTLRLHYEDQMGNGHSPVKTTELTTGGIRCADHATPSIRKSWH
jgi:hypothetical protein